LSYGFESGRSIAITKGAIVFFGGPRSVQGLHAHVVWSQQAVLNWAILPNWDGASMLGPRYLSIPLWPFGAVIAAFAWQLSRRLTKEVACVGCGYDLSGLRAGTRCSECAQSSNR
jgi:hypothetical protein